MHELTHSPVMWTEWRRAVLIAEVLKCDTLGIAHALLGDVLPPQMLWTNAPRVAPPPLASARVSAVSLDGAVARIVHLLHMVNPSDAHIDASVGRRCVHKRG